jgi:prepilin-type N-terminal cleavage/methylation domain-containing protein/prepilin-type processing-associated H-X9-DG protein
MASELRRNAMLLCSIITQCFKVTASRNGNFLRRAGGFTLVELLVVISIIALLLGILLPSLGKSRQKALSIVCASRMHQISTASMMYQETENQFARSSHSAEVYECLRWGPAFMSYLGYGRYKGSTTPAWDTVFKKFYRCPSDKRKDAHWSYGKNVWYELESTEVAEALGTDSGPTYRALTQIPHPRATVEFGELIDPSQADHFMAHFWLGGTSVTTPQEVDVKIHGRTASNYSYLDGHVNSQEFKETFDPSKKIDNWNPGTAH